MKASDFRRIALSFEGAEEGSHMDAPDFRVGGRIFATLASEKKGYGNLMLTPEQQGEFVPCPSLPVPPLGFAVTRRLSSCQADCDDMRRPICSEFGTLQTRRLQEMEFLPVA
jgi:hypothetical protein